MPTNGLYHTPIFLPQFMLTPTPLFVDTIQTILEDEMEQDCERETKESQQAIVEPSSLDILHGRDRTSTQHTGNKCFRALIDFSLKDHMALSTESEKNKFVRVMVRCIQASGGRFLQRQSGDKRRWEEVDPKMAKEKVRHAFRDIEVKGKKLPKSREEGSSPVIRPYYISAALFDWKSIVANAESANRTSTHEVIREPTDLDILHGKDDFSIHHIGNLCFHTLIDYSFPQYFILSNRSAKGKFLSAIVNTINDSGGRFLHRREGGEGWEQDDVPKANETVGRALRNARKKPAVFYGPTLINGSDLLHRYNTEYDFDWRGMVEIAQRRQSEMNNSSASDNDNVDLDDDIRSISVSSFLWDFSRDDIQLDTLSIVSFHE